MLSCALPSQAQDPGLKCSTVCSLAGYCAVDNRLASRTRISGSAKGTNKNRFIEVFIITKIVKELYIKSLTVYIRMY